MILRHSLAADLAPLRKGGKEARLYRLEGLPHGHHEAITAITTSTPLQLGFRNDPSYFGIDNISVLPLGPFPPFPPQASAASVADGSCQFSWNTVNTFPPVGYQVQYNTNLADPTWLNLGGVLTGTNAMLSFTNSPGADPQRFYRVLLVQ